MSQMYNIKRIKQLDVRVQLPYLIEWVGTREGYRITRWVGARYDDSNGDCYGTFVDAKQKAIENLQGEIDLLKQALKELRKLKEKDV
jgi:hypothetical protein